MADDPVDLSPEELADLVVVAETATPAESMYLIDVLSAEGIPVVGDDSSAMGLMGPIGSNKIRVPRATEKKAREIVGRARSQAEKKSIEDAFTPEAAEETVAQSDAPLEDLELVELRDLDSESRDRRLRILAAKWLQDGEHISEIARRMGLSGIDQNAAAKLLDEVAEASVEEIEAANSSKRYMGFGLVAAGVVLIILCSIKGVGGLIIYFSITTLIGVGLAIFFLSTRPVPRLSKNETDVLKKPDDPS